MSKSKSETAIFTLSVAFASALVMTAAPANAQMIDYACVYGGYCPSRPSAPQAPNPAPQAPNPDRRDFTVKNDNELAITGIYVSPSNSNYWGNNILKEDILYSGKSTKVTFSNSSTQCIYDVKAIYENRTYDMSKRNLCNISGMKYFGNGGNFAGKPVQSQPSQRQTKRQCINTMLNAVWPDVHCQSSGGYGGGMFEWRTVYVD